jgi:hypothetical protein
MHELLQQRRAGEPRAFLHARKLPGDREPKALWPLSPKPGASAGKPLNSLRHFVSHREFSTGA